MINFNTESIPNLSCLTVMLPLMGSSLSSKEGAFASFFKCQKYTVRLQEPTEMEPYVVLSEINAASS